jgi:prepilin-type processing-associated H-X9-DG protein
MSAFENILSYEFVQKLGWTLLHFIWQATAVTLLAAILLRIMRRFSASLRYVTTSLALVLIVLLPVVTMHFVKVESPPVPVDIESISTPVILPTEPAEEMPLTRTTEYELPVQSKSSQTNYFARWKQRAVSFLEPALPHIVTGWLLGVFALSLWHLGGWAQLQKLRKKMVKQVDASLVNKLNILAKKLGVTQSVEILESTLVQIPTVIGWLRPVILLPASAFTGLSTEQLQAILAHELAHIKRFDYLVNILQTIVEILGFYHPAVWWLSHKIRVERENCCDDLAIAVTKDRICYARALTSMEEIRGRGELAVAATGGNLFSRIRRLIGKDANEKTFSWVPAVSIIMLIIALAIPTTHALATKSISQQVDPNSWQEKASSDEQSDEKLEISTEKIKQLGLAIVIYTNIYDNKLPDSVEMLKPYFENKQNLQWILENVEYLGKGKIYQPNQPQILVAYDKTLLHETNSTNVLFMDSHVEHFQREKFEMLMRIERHSESYKKISELGRAMVLYGDDYQGHLPDNLQELVPYWSYKKDIDWLNQNVKYLGKGKTEKEKPDTIIAYDKSLLAVDKGTFILFLDGHVEFVEAEKLKELGIGTIPVQIGENLEFSTEKLKQLGLALAIYAADNDSKLPETLDILKPYLANEKIRFWVQNNVVYLGKGRSRKENTLSKIPIAYDKSLLKSQQGTNVLFLDAHVEFLETERLKELGINPIPVHIELRLLYVGEEFMDEIGRIFTFKPDSHTWLDGSQVTSLFQAVRKVKDAKMLTAPRVTVLDNEMAQLFMGQEVPSVSGYTEPKSSSEKPEPIIVLKEIGTSCEITPHVSPDKQDVLLQFELQISQLIGFEERIYKGRYKEKVPQIETKSIANSIAVPNGKTLFVDGGMMTLYEIENFTTAKDGRGRTGEEKRLIILFKPDILTQEQAERPAFSQNVGTTSMGGYGNELPPGFGGFDDGGYEAIAPDTLKGQKEVPPAGKLPESWSLYYDDGLTSDGGKRWPANMAENLASLEVAPRPFNINDESWKNETLKFDIRSINGTTMGSISVRPEAELREMRRKIFQPDKYMLSYRREWGKPGNNFRMNCGPFLLDLSEPGMYELQFSPKLGEVVITGSAGGCYAVNFEKTDRGVPVRGFAYINRLKEYKLDGLPPGKYRLSAVAQQNNGNVLVSRAEVIIEKEEKVTVDIAPAPKGNCSLKGTILGRQRTYSIDKPLPHQSQGEWYVLIRKAGSGNVETTFAYESLTMDSFYVVRGNNITQDTTDRASYKIEGIVPDEYTVTAIENPRMSGSLITRQQSKPLILKAGREAVLDFDLRETK